MGRGLSGLTADIGRALNVLNSLTMPDSRDLCYKKITFWGIRPKMAKPWRLLQQGHDGVSNLPQ
jgi:hypothetical protein